MLVNMHMHEQSMHYIYFKKKKKKKEKKAGLDAKQNHTLCKTQPIWGMRSPLGHINSPPPYVGRAYH